MVLAAAPSPYWFITRGTGAMALVLLTVSVALGVANVRRMQFANLRFVLDALHRDASLVAVAFVLLHVVTTLLDGFAPIGLLDVVIPFHSAYRPLWLGLGAVSFDLMAAVMITSLARHRFGVRVWRATHWLAYVSWPIALVHSYGTGSDPKAHWMLVLTGLCVAVVLVAVAARVSAGWPEHLPARLSALGAAALIPLGLVAWLPSGPLASGWARRAGTPPAVLAAARAGTTPSASGGATAGSGGASAARGLSVTARFRGRVRQMQLGPGAAAVDISLVVADPRLRRVHIRIEGRGIPGGGVDMSDSQVSAGPSSNPDRYAGHVTALSGPTIQASASDSTGTTVQIVAQLQNQGPGGAAEGVLTARAGATP
ncbi:MAG: ferric reductase-like transmembrane domain-containing protein [Solirubrobacteraceae bacterium]